MSYFAICAGVCGRTLNGGATSLPAGVRTCRPCRRAGHGPRRAKTRDCSVCGSTFYPNDHGGRKQLTCSRQCGAVNRLAKFETMRRPARLCGCCGQVDVTWPLTYCPDCAEVRRAERNQRKNLRRRAGGAQVMSIRELGERDRWRCHLCRRPVDPALKYPDQRAGSRDHLIPVADGGTNAPANMALAHWDCNVRRNTGGTVQLALVG